MHAANGGDIFQRFFPRKFRLQSGRWFDTPRYLLEYTHHSPRDFLQLLQYIADMCRSGNIEGRVPGRVVEAAAHNYCEEYFVGELRNELDGFLSMQDIELTKRLLRGLRRHRFYFHELETKVARSKQYEDLPVRDVVARLYDAGVIGNVVAAAHEERVHFKYRNPHHDIDYDAQLVLHNALVNAFNTPRALAGQL